MGNSAELAGQRRSEAHFGLWATIKAPLLIGADLRTIDKTSLEVLKNEDVIAINQDSLGVAGDLIYMHGAVQVLDPLCDCWCTACSCVVPLSPHRQRVDFHRLHVCGEPIGALLARLRGCACSTLTLRKLLVHLCTICDQSQPAA